MDFTDDRPIYQQIAEDIRRRVLTGELAPGDKLMSTTQYATTYRINPATANKAFALLVDEGTVEKRRGIGMFVAPRAAEKIRAKRKQAFFEQYVRPLAAEAKNIGITPAELQAMLAQASEKE